MNGVTLVELLAALAVVALLALAGLPNMLNWLAQERAAAALNQMLGAVQTTRQAAVSLRSPVTLCPGRGQQCGPRDSWHVGMLIFTDRNLNRRIDGNDRVVTALPKLAEGDRIRWRSFRNRSTLTIRPTGLTDWQNGSFTYCQANAGNETARVLILNTAGRARRGRDRDGDGIVEDASGKPLSC